MQDWCVCFPMVGCQPVLDAFGPGGRQSHGAEFCSPGAGLYGKPWVLQECGDLFFGIGAAVEKFDELCCPLAFSFIQTAFGFADEKC